MPATIWTDIDKLTKYLDIYRRYDVIGCTSGGYDIFHSGHARCIYHSSRLCKHLVVIVNGDGFLVRKKGYFIMPLAERMEIVSYLQGVNHILAWDDGSEFVDGALKAIKPHIFFKGGDRSSPDTTAECERKACEAIDCIIAYGVGGYTKIQSSSKLAGEIERAKLSTSP